MVWEEIVKKAKILIVDDEPAQVRMIERMLLAVGYAQVLSSTDSREAVALFRESEPDLILLDLEMSDLSGYEVLDQLAPHVPEDSYLPIVVISGLTPPEHRLRALLAGAKDFIGKPVDRLELMLRVRIQLETRFLFLKLSAPRVTRTPDGV